MEYRQVKEKLLDLFNRETLQAVPGEWGFFNESDREIKRIGYAVNLSREIIQKAGEAQVDLLLTHHDSWGFIYGLKEICDQLLIEHNLTHAFFHAPLDGAAFGTSASLAKAMGLRNCEPVMPYAGVYQCGIVGEADGASFYEWKERLTGILQEEIRCYRNHDKPIRKIAVAAGGGNMTTEMRIAVEHGCDTYVTGEYALYSQQYAECQGMNLFVGSHTNTEIRGVMALAELLCERTDLRRVRIVEANY